MRIGLFGGSFDPIHHGHLLVAQAALEALALDTLWFVPAGEQPFKVGRHGASAADRYDLVAAAVAGDPRFVADRSEVDRPGPSYTIETLRAVRAARPSDELFLLVGADVARELPAWRDADALAGLATIVVLTRSGSTLPDHPLLPARVSVPAIAITASEIRARCARGDSIRYLVPDAVRELIAARGLYSQGD